MAENNLDQRKRYKDFDAFMGDAGEDYRRLFNQETFILEVTESICKYMNENNISRTELARRLDRTKGFVSQVLNGSRNVTLRTLADILWALGCEPRFQVVPIGLPRVDEKAEWQKWSRTRIVGSSWEETSVAPSIKKKCIGSATKKKLVPKVNESITEELSKAEGWT